jgi:hypothetical protein
MLCRTGVERFEKGIQSKEDRAREDENCDVLTVWDVVEYNKLRKAGKSKEEAGEGAYRRINMADVKAISIQPVIEREQVRVERGNEVPERV